MVRSAKPILPPPLDARPHPLGPLVVRHRLVHRGSRLVAGVLSFALLTPIGIAIRLSPDPAGAGTHRQLGLQACSMLQLTGYPCPTCGMTTAFSHVVRGNVAEALHAQPMGVLLAAGLVICAFVSAAAAATGYRRSVNWYRVSPKKAVIVIVLLFVAAWGYKILTTAGAR